MGFKPLADRVLIKPEPVEEVTEAGIILAQSKTSQAPTTGVVIAIGLGRWQNAVLITPEVKPGDKVMFSKFASTELEVEGIELITVREGDISGILT